MGRGRPARRRPRCAVGRARSRRLTPPHRATVHVVPCANRSSGVLRDTGRAPAWRRVAGSNPWLAVPPQERRNVEVFDLVLRTSPRHLGHGRSRWWRAERRGGREPWIVGGLGPDRDCGRTLLLELAHEVPVLTHAAGVRGTRDARMQLALARRIEPGRDDG